MTFDCAFLVRPVDLVLPRKRVQDSEKMYLQAAAREGEGEGEGERGKLLGLIKSFPHFLDCVLSPVWT